ncbi:fungal-specific transcription factor domain-containing protein [Durotheca rogersii]|uniref:fungal-specific transcription factor domain-containing protein n=1 Tax=Durotheca rogersii TaxID=419775 RepID=UPI00221FFD81|nr:fungal-specific transcription factor domain-containing protein [Durotheca rogersii]KAI5868269.1 fungal-specific transcription factor domain-containing protein [Durotheca rogersii]
MPRSSFSENPLLRVSRPVSACSRCRAAKVKCDGKLPACTACEKAGRENECSAANDQFARGKERSYVAALELRIEKLEKRLEYARSRKASVAQHESEAAPAAPESDRKDSLAIIKAAIYRKAARKREMSDVNSLLSDFGFLSINATTRDFEPSMTNMTFARLVLAAASNDPLPEIGDWALPPRQDALPLVQHYMANIYSLYPAFPETTLYTILDQMYSFQERAIKDADYWLVYMVLAIGSTAQSRAKDDDYYINGLCFVSRALQHADRALMPGYTTQIQCLILLTQYSMLDPTHFDSWHLIGFTCRAVIDLGFHQDPPIEQLPDKAALDMRRKTFYCVYSLDRSISMVHARAFSFTDAATNVAWPRPSSFSRRASITGQILSGSEPAFLLFQLRRAQSHWYQALFQSEPTPLPDAPSFIWKVCQDMREWAEALPTSLPPGMRELFDLELRYSFVYCIAPSARAPHLTDYGRLLIFEHAIAYVERIFEIAHAGGGANVGRNTAFYTYHDALRVFFMASQFVAVLRDAEDLLLAGVTVPLPLVELGKPPPPPLPRPGAGIAGANSGGGLPAGAGGATADNVDRSIACLEKAARTLAKYGERWDTCVSLQQSFELISAELSDRLRVRKQMQRYAPPHSHPQHPQHAHAHSGQHIAAPPPPREMKWVDVDVEALMRTGAGAGGGSRAAKFEQ